MCAFCSPSLQTSWNDGTAQCGRGWGCWRSIETSSKRFALFSHKQRITQPHHNTPSLPFVLLFFLFLLRAQRLQRGLMTFFFNQMLRESSLLFVRLQRPLVDSLALRAVLHRREALLVIHALPLSPLLRPYIAASADLRGFKLEREDHRLFAADLADVSLRAAQLHETETPVLTTQSCVMCFA